MKCGMTSSAPEEHCQPIALEVVRDDHLYGMWHISQSTQAVRTDTLAG